jgi:hypothetical protein
VLATPHRTALEIDRFGAESMQRHKEGFMKPRFSMILLLQLFSLAIVLFSFSFNGLLLRALGTSVQLTPSLMGNALLLTGILGILTASILGVQKCELDKLKAEVAILSNSMESSKP